MSMSESRIGATGISMRSCSLSPLETEISRFTSS